MDKVGIIKGVVNLVTGACVGKTVDIFLTNNLPRKAIFGTKERIAMTIGSAVIGAYISSKCSEYVENEIDEVAKMVETIKGSVTITKEPIVIEDAEVVEED